MSPLQALPAKKCGLGDPNPLSPAHRGVGAVQRSAGRNPVNPSGSGDPTSGDQAVHQPEHEHDEKHEEQDACDRHRLAGHTGKAQQTGDQSQHQEDNRPSKHL